MTNLATPAPTPAEKILRRVLFISLWDGWSLIVIAALGLLVTLLLGDLSGIAIALLVLLAGLIELRGRKQLQRRNAEGMKLLVRSQVFLLTVILVYCASRLGSYDAESMLSNLTPDMRAMLTEAGLQVSDIVPLVHTAFLVLYITVALVTLIYQGGLALYYRSRTKPVAEALAARSNGPLA